MASYVKNKGLHILNYIRTVGKWLIMAIIVGAIGGPVGALFHGAVEWANGTFDAHRRMIWLLPLAGVVIVALYTATHMLESAGTDEVIGSVRSGKNLRLTMAPLIFISTLLTHLFGGSAGREGAALQLGGSIGVRVGKWMKLDKQDMRIITLCGMSALFSALFCTPLTAVFFAIEVISVGVMYYAALLPCMTSSLIAYVIALLCGTHPLSFSPAIPAVSADVLWRVAVLAVLCAGVSVVFCLAMREAGRYFKRFFKNPFIRIITGALAVILLSYLCGTSDYNGSGLTVIAAAVNDGSAVPSAFLWKMLFTSITIGCGFKGGEIVPTLFIGSTFGCVAGGLLGLDPGFAAAIGMIAVFCGVVNCPVASIILSVELFGSSGLLLFAPACILSYLLSGDFGLYHAQHIVYSKLRAQFIDRPVK